MIKAIRNSALIIVLSCLATFCGAIVDAEFGTELTTAFFFIAGVIFSDIERRL